MTISREHFEAWLFSQPLAKVLEYSAGSRFEPTGCLICNYLRDSFKQHHLYVGVDNFTMVGNTVGQNKFPPWLVDLILVAREEDSEFFTIEQVQSAYLSLFGPISVPVDATPTNVLQPQQGWRI